MKAYQLVCALLLVLAGGRPATADTQQIITALRQGGYVLVFRHAATDDSQKDVYPFKFDDMTAQRQLSEQGREMARQMGAAIKKLEIPIGDVYTSQLNRAVETGQLISGKDVKPVAALTDSSAARAPSMTNPSGTNAKAGLALKQLLDKPPMAATNTFLVTHKTNIADAFGREASDVEEGEAFVYHPAETGPATLVARIKASDWITQAGK